MKKIPTLFVRDWQGDRSRVLNEVTPGCEWVLAGEGVATRKRDGTAVLIQNGQLWRRYDAKRGKKPPAGFVPTQDTPDPETGHFPGWLPVPDDTTESHFRDALELARTLPNGTYELCGPKVQGNSERFERHVLIQHGEERLLAWFHQLDYDSIKTYLAVVGIEGIVWHHPDGRMTKIKSRDFGLPWPVE